MPKANKTNIIAGLFTAFAFEELTVSNSVKTLTSTKYLDTDGENATRAIITIQDAQIRYMYNGDTPTASLGHVVNPFDTITLLGSQNIRNFKAIRKGSTDAKISCTYEK